MLRLILFLAFIIAMASGLAWLADRPGLIVVNWEGYQAEISVFHAVVALALFAGVALVVWSLLRHIWESPATIGSYFNRRRQKRGLDALSTGMIAIGAGDRTAATKYAIQARKSMPNEPLTHLLRAQAAQLSGDKATARRIYESMLASTDTEQLGLRGLFLEAEREGELEAAKQFAERAVALNPQLSWPVDALFDLQCKAEDWPGALSTLAIARKNGHVEKASADRRRAVLMTAQAQNLEDKDPERALNLALDANKLAADLIPAAAIAGRILASRGNTPKAAKILQKTWQKAPHPDLATAYAYARLGDSPRDRLDRVKKLAGLNPHSLESAIAVANASIEASDFASARHALKPLLENRLTQRVCTLMARVEGEEHGDKGAVREWLARAVNAPRDPAWTADGVVSEQWAAVSPVTGALDAFRWRVPVENMDKSADEIVARKLEELVALGAPLAVATKDVTPNGDAKGGDAPDSPAAETKAGASSLRPTEVSDADVVDVTVVPDKATAAKTAETELETPTSASGTEPPKVDPVATAAASKGEMEPESAKKSEAKAQAADKEPKVDPSKTSTTEEVTAVAAPQAAPTSAVAKDADARPEAQKVESADKKEVAPAPTAEAAPASTAAAKAAVEKPAAKAAASEPTERSGRRGASEARIFVSPRAPDDPGPTDLEPPVDVKGPPKPYRVHS